MTLSPKKTTLEALLLDIKQVETRLDAATRDIEEFYNGHPDASATDALALANHIEDEKNQAQEWAKNFDKIVNYQPCNFEDLKYKTLVLLEYADTGHDNPSILKTIKNDLQAFSYTEAIPLAYRGSSRRRQA